MPENKDVIEKSVRNVLTGILADVSVELVALSYHRQGPRHVLRILIDTPEGVTLDLCTSVNRQLSRVLDEEDIIPGKYYLEVSSPGIDRPLRVRRDFQRAICKKIAVFMPGRTCEGVLEKVTDTEITVETIKGPQIFKIEEISKAHRVIEI